MEVWKKHGGIWLVLLIGVAARMWAYLQNRSFFIDEANVARNIAERTYAGFFEPLDHHQHAPPILLSGFKLCTDGFGFSEYSLRFIPLVGGLLSVYFFYRLLQKLVEQLPALLFPLLLLACSPEMVRYATEAKQYSTDILVTIGILLVAVYTRPIPRSRSSWIVLGFMGMLLPWFSMTSVFALTGLGFFWLALIIQSRQWKTLPWVLACGGFWLVSFGIYYFTQLRSQIGLDYLQSYHQSYFLNLLPTSWSEVQRSGSVIRSIFRTAADKTVLGIGGAVLFFLLGVFALRKRVPFLLLFGIPLLAMAVASHLHLYAFTPRLALFMIPMIWAVMGIGLDWIWPRLPFGKWGKAVLILLISIMLINQGGWRSLINGYEVEALRPLLRKLEKRIAKEDTIWVYHRAVPAFEVYHRYHQDPISFEKTPILLGQWEETPLRDSIEPPLWMVFAHIDPVEKPRVLEYVQASFDVHLAIEEVGAQAYKVTQ